MNRAKYLQHMDLLQDAIAELGEATLQQLVKKTGLSYGQAQYASVGLRSRGRVEYERAGRVLIFRPLK